MVLEFKKATKTQAKARIALIGPSGSGKTYTALRVATGLGQNIAVIDTEHGSASKYADEFNFAVLELSSFSPDVYVEAIRAAEKAGFDVIIIDSLSHAWVGKGGALELVDSAAKRLKGNSFVAWGEVTPKQNAMVEAIIGSSCHIIATIRSKMDHVIENINGKQTPRKVGMAAVQRDGIEYEFDITGDLDIDHNLIISKTRCRILDNAVIARPGPDLGQTIKAWLSDGAVAAPKPLPQAPQHWSEKAENRQMLADMLAREGIAIEALFQGCEVADWADMIRYEGDGKDAIKAAKAWNQRQGGKPVKVKVDPDLTDTQNGLFNDDPVETMVHELNETSNVN